MSLFGDKKGPTQPPAPVHEPSAPYSAGQVTDLIEGTVDFRVRKISQSSGLYWRAQGTALVHLNGAVKANIVEHTGRHGSIESVSVHLFNAAGKESLVFFGTEWHDNGEDGSDEWTCTFEIDSVELVP